MKCIIVSSFTLCVMICRIASANSQDLSTPESAVRSFLTAYCKGDYVQATSCVENAKYNSQFDSMAQDEKKHPATFTLASVKTDLNGDDASVTAKATLKEARSETPQTFSTDVKLHRTGAAWHIVADTAPPVPAQWDDIDMVRSMAWAFADPHTMMPTFWAARNKARVKVCLSNVKMMGLGVLMLLQDHDDRFALKADRFQKAISPYIKDGTVFHCPSDDAGVTSYAFNANLSGKKISSVRLPAATVMIYEGKAGKLDYEHDGAAALCFADGHAVMVTEAEAKKLRWMP